MRELDEEIDTLKARWMTGGSAVSACPQAWRGVVGEEAPDLSLLALTGQFTRLATRPQPGGELAERPLLPTLPLPLIPDSARLLLRRALGTKNIVKSSIISLVAARGFVVSPIDWMPKPGDDQIPDVYAPWGDWVSMVDAAGSVHTITADNWKDWRPSERHRALLAMRKADPDAAREVLAAVVSAVPPKEKLKLVPILTHGLSEADGPLLSTIARGQDIAAGNARELLSRLGSGASLETGEEDPDRVAELAAFFKVSRRKGRRARVVVTATPLKSDAQSRRRSKLVRSFSLDGLAKALGITAGEFVNGWDFDEDLLDIGHVVERSATDEDVQVFLARRLKASKNHMHQLGLIGRLPADQRLAFAKPVIDIDEMTLTATLNLLDPVPGTLPFDVIEQAPPFMQLCDVLADENTALEHMLQMGLMNLAYIADREEAQRIIDLFIDLGMMPADPRLTLLRLNAAL
ncbi:MAG: DUF5691 domain-containing protein [Pseudomonadota bacterium]